MIIPEIATDDELEVSTIDTLDRLSRLDVVKPPVVGDVAGGISRGVAEGAQLSKAYLQKGISEDAYEKSVRSYDQMKSNPYNSGFASEALRAVAESLTVFGAGAAAEIGLATAATAGTGVAPALVASPFVGAAFTGLVYGSERGRELEKQGVDFDTRFNASLTTGILSGAGALVGEGPIANLAAKTAAGAAINVSFGAAERFAIGDILRNKGYDEIAGDYEALDTGAIIADALLGSALAAGPHLFSESATLLKSSSLIARKAQVDALSVDRIGETPEARAAHMDALDAATESLARGEPVSVEGVIAKHKYTERLGDDVPELRERAAAMMDEGALMNMQAVSDLANSRWGKYIIPEDMIDPLTEMMSGKSDVVSEEGIPDTPQKEIVDTSHDEMIRRIVAENQDRVAVTDTGEKSTIVAEAKKIESLSAKAEQDINLVTAAVNCFVKTIK